MGISIVDAFPRELLYISFDNIELQAMSSASTSSTFSSESRLARETSASTNAVHLELRGIQVDNQLRSTPFPVLLQFSRSRSRSSQPVFELTFIKHNEYANIDFIRYLSVQTLPMSIRIDWSLVSLLASVVLYGREAKGGNDIAVTESRQNLKNDKNQRLQEFEESTKGSEVKGNNGTNMVLSNNEFSNTSTVRKPSGNHTKQQVVLAEERKLYFENLHIHTIEVDKCTSWQFLFCCIDNFIL